MRNFGKDDKKAQYARPQLRCYGDFLHFTASGSGFQTEVFGDNPGMAMMKRP
jgi:hypothetical protein